jgi:long-chain acyl-CoA synthetase
MRLFIAGGAKMNAQVYDDFLDWGFCLAQGYGLTEATAIITATPLDELRGDTVGKPVEGVEVRIHEADAEGVGEVWATGPSLMTGYYRNPDATEQALTGDGWLRTGDLGRLLPDGHLQITGRAKDVIVLSSGKNIYPDELEGHYGQSELVDEICIVGIPDEAGRGERLHAIVVPDLEAARRRGYVNVREMIAWEIEGMGAKLPGPQRLTSLELRAEPLPRTPTRKVKRYVLMQEIAERRPGAHAEPVTTEDSAAGAGEPAGDLPAGAGELMELVARFAKREKVAPADHLDLDLGLESLDRIELLAELERLRRVSLDEETAGRVHTVGELLEALAAAEAEQRGAGGGQAGSGGGRVGGSEPTGEGQAGVGGAAASADRWDAVLREAPEGIDRYLVRRPVFETLMWLLLRLGRGLLGLLAGYHVSGIERLPPGRALLLCANHASYVDPMVLCMALPREALGRVFFVGYSEYFEGWVGRTLGRLVRNIPIDPNRNLERAMQAAAEGLRRGMILVIFPEGARSLDGSVREFRRGAAILASHLEVPIAPAGIWGAHRLLPREGRMRRHAVAIELGEPLVPRAGEGDEALTARLREQVAALVERAGQCLFRHP